VLFAVFCVLFCWPLFVLLDFFIWPWYYVFELQLLITPMTSSNYFLHYHDLFLSLSRNLLWSFWPLPRVTRHVPHMLWKRNNCYKKNTIEDARKVVHGHSSSNICGIARNHGWFCSWIFINQIASFMTSANKRWTIFGRGWW
jgi:hypothetical protein